MNKQIVPSNEVPSRVKSELKRQVAIGLIDNNHCTNYSFDQSIEDKTYHLLPSGEYAITIEESPKGGTNMNYLQDANYLNEQELFDLAQGYMNSNEMELMEQVVSHLVSCGFDRDEIILDLIEGVQEQ